MKGRIQKKPTDVAKVERLSKQLLELEEVLKLQAEKLSITWHKMVELTDRLFVETTVEDVEARALLTRQDGMVNITPLIPVGTNGVHSIHIITQNAIARENHLLSKRFKLLPNGDAIKIGRDDNEW